MVSMISSLASTADTGYTPPESAYHTTQSELLLRMCSNSSVLACKDYNHRSRNEVMCWGPALANTWKDDIWKLSLALVFCKIIKLNKNNALKLVSNTHLVQKFVRQYSRFGENRKGVPTSKR